MLGIPSPTSSLTTAEARTISVKAHRDGERRPRDRETRGPEPSPGRYGRGRADAIGGSSPRDSMQEECVDRAWSATA